MIRCMCINRHIETFLLQRTATRPVVVLTGTQQTGKTSLMRRLFPDHAFVSLDLPSEAAQAEDDPVSFRMLSNPKECSRERKFSR